MYWKFARSNDSVWTRIHFHDCRSEHANIGNINKFLEFVHRHPVFLFLQNGRSTNEKTTTSIICILNHPLALPEYKNRPGPHRSKGMSSETTVVRNVQFPALGQNTKMTPQISNSWRFTARHHKIESALTKSGHH